MYIFKVMSSGLWSLQLQLKFLYSEKATKFDEISKFYLKLLRSFKKRLEISSYFCGLLRIYELYWWVVITNWTIVLLKYHLRKNWKSKKWNAAFNFKELMFFKSIFFSAIVALKWKSEKCFRNLQTTCENVDLKPFGLQ